jgi:uncharacterized membrane protein
MTMYFLDRDAGGRRRARARELATHATHVAAHGIGIGARDLEHRLHGMVRAPTREAKTGDDVVAARVRSRLGHACSHPHAIAVSCRGGSVELSGPILGVEADAVLRATHRVFGVHDVVDRLERHGAPDGVPGLQGPSRAARRKPGYWPPATRLAVGSTGAGAILLGLVRGGFGGIGAALLGTVAVARSLANVRVSELAGAFGRRPAIDVEKTITLHAPLEDVLELFTNPANLPRFMRHVKEVRRIGDDRWRWTVTGPRGMPREWEGFLDRLIPNEEVSWKSVEGVSAGKESSVVFETTAPGVTRLTIRLRYWPPGGLVGHEIARLLGDDPERELDEDMLRLKSLVEVGTGSSLGAGST